MEYSEIVTLTKEGFQIPEKLLHPVGVYDGSRCWGTIIYNNAPQINKAAFQIEKNASQINGVGSVISQPANQILLSPIPFGSWACTVRIQARLKDEPGKLKSLIKILAENNLYTNIISISQNSCGYNNGRVNILVELSDLRTDAKEILRDTTINEKKIENLTEYSKRVFERLLKIENAILKEDESQDENRKFLYRANPAMGGSYLWHNRYMEDKIKNESDSDALRKKYQSCSVRILICEWLRTQAMCFLYSLEEQPLRFDYSLREKLLKSPSGSDSSALCIARDLKIDLPAVFLGTFNPISKYIRLVSLQDDTHRKPLVKINYSYTCNSNSKDKNKDISENGSNGLLYHRTKRLAIKAPLKNLEESKIDEHRRAESFDFNIKNAISYSKRTSRYSESGEIEILGYCEGISRPCLERIPSEIVSRIKGYADKDTKKQFKKTVDVNFKNPYRIFLSCREEIKKDKTFKNTYGRVATKYGVTIELSDESAEIVTADVLNKVSSVDALIVIFSLTDMEHQEYMLASDKTRYTPNLGWLLFELGIGMGKKIPTVQLRDVTVVTKTQWSHWVNVGKDASLSFIDRKKPDEMEAHLEDAIKVILGKLSSRSCISK